VRIFLLKCESEQGSGGMDFGLEITTSLGSPQACPSCAPIDLILTSHDSTVILISEKISQCTVILHNSRYRQILLYLSRPIVTVTAISHHIVYHGKSVRSVVVGLVSDR